MPKILSLKEYAKHNPNPRIEHLNGEIDRLYDYYGNIVEAHPTARYAMTIATNTSYPCKMRVEALVLAKKVLIKSDLTKFYNSVK